MGILNVRNFVGLMNSQFRDYKMKYKIFSSTCCRVLPNINKKPGSKPNTYIHNFLVYRTEVRIGLICKELVPYAGQN